ncbi:hypothetical protein [Thiorhodococcus fuscus]|uniref:HK97 gp10 family phage protein n=1 Tax=Thiorhodococcus fuscus TaxID=527200 RepID=A0ABW4Y7N7_9GAMM
MINIELDGLNAVIRRFEQLSADIKPAVAAGINRTMDAMEQHELVAMERELDRPTPFSLNAIQIFKARASRLDAVLFVKPIQARYLKYAIKGGLIPVNITPTRAARLNKFGNLPGKRRGLEGIAGKARTKFVGEVNGIYGVWQRYGRGGSKLKLLAKIEREAERSKRWEFYETGQKVARDRLVRDVVRALRDAG